MFFGQSHLLSPSSFGRLHLVLLGGPWLVFILVLLLALWAFLCLSLSLVLPFMSSFLWGFLKVEVCRVLGVGQGQSLFLAKRAESRELTSWCLQGNAAAGLRMGQGAPAEDGAGSPKWLAVC